MCVGLSDGRCDDAGRGRTPRGALSGGGIGRRGPRGGKLGSLKTQTEQASWRITMEKWTIVIGMPFDRM